MTKLYVNDVMLHETLSFRKKKLYNFWLDQIHSFIHMQHLNIQPSAKMQCKLICAT